MYRGPTDVSQNGVYDIIKGRRSYLDDRYGPEEEETERFEYHDVGTIDNFDMRSTGVSSIWIKSLVPEALCPGEKLYSPKPERGMDKNLLILGHVTFSYIEKGTAIHKIEIYSSTYQRDLVKGMKVFSEHKATKKVPANPPRGMTDDEHRKCVNERLVAAGKQRKILNGRLSNRNSLYPQNYKSSINFHQCSNTFLSHWDLNRMMHKDLMSEQDLENLQDSTFNPESYEVPELVSMGPEVPELMSESPEVPALMPMGPVVPELLPMGPEVPELVPESPEVPELTPESPEVPELTPAIYEDPELKSESSEDSDSDDSFEELEFKSDSSDDSELQPDSSENSKLNPRDPKVLYPIAKINLLSDTIPSILDTDESDSLFGSERNVSHMISPVYYFEGYDSLMFRNDIEENMRLFREDRKDENSCLKIRESFSDILALRNTNLPKVPAIVEKTKSDEEKPKETLSSKISSFPNCPHCLTREKFPPNPYFPFISPRGSNMVIPPVCSQHPHEPLAQCSKQETSVSSSSDSPRPDLVKLAEEPFCICKKFCKNLSKD